MQPFTTILFDVDGVLVDSKSAYLGFYNDVRRHVGLPPMSAEEEVSVFSYTFNDGFAFLIPEPLRKEGMRFVQATRFEDYLPVIRPMPGAAQALDELARRGFRLGVCTNGGRREVGVVFEALGLAGKIHRLVTSSDVPRPKPHPDGLLALLEGFNAPKGHAVYVGDSPIDSQAARAAGVAFWAFDNPRLEADRHLTDHGMLLDLLARP